MTKQPVTTSRLQQAKIALERLEAQEELYLDELNDNEENLIRLYEKMHRQLKLLVRAEPESYIHYEREIRKQLVNAYIKYGTYLKSTQKDFGAARSSLEKALKLTMNLPIAYYRLGFLAYKRQAYVEALYNFNQAIYMQGEENEHQLSLQQQSYVQLYLANSALYVAHAANEELGRLPETQQLASYELSPIYAQLADQEQFLLQNSFYRFSAQGVEKCSARECEWVCETPRTLVLYFSDRENVCFYNGRAINLAINLANTLRHLLLTCSAQSPGRSGDFAELFDGPSRGEVRTDAFRQRISRLRGKLAQIGLTDVVIQTRVAEETAYYIEEMPFFVLYRVDEQTEYDYTHLL